MPPLSTVAGVPPLGDFVTVFCCKIVYLKEKQKGGIKMKMIIDEKLREIAEADGEKFIQVYTKMCSS